ncbi:hypothetical protein Mal52_55780 [Symmachiella dynata]|uniref:Uncharacterized protein n=1 Tax=Symmachiella dynata TaxID=2527995 RepID=A0A517ZX59_9PLAN|nr:hypothetical protein Mal52_55780 [Symmachiella dynata]
MSLPYDYLQRRPHAVASRNPCTGKSSDRPSSPLKKGATGGLSASANCVASKNTAGQASSGTRLANVFGFSTDC